jgi:exonuclease SbcC
VADENRLLQALDAEVEALVEAYINAQGAFKSATAKNESLVAQLQALKSTLETLRIDWKSALKKSFFRTEVEYLQAVVALSELALLREEINTFELQRMEIDGALKAQKQLIGEHLEPDLEALEDALEQSSKAQQRAENDWSAIDKKSANLTLSAQQIAAHSEHNSRLEKHYEVVGTLSDVANGFTADKISLQRFVLSALLDDVLVEASSRLQLMSKGRYQLLRKEERAKGNKASGLELVVDDADPGKVRAVATLSDGESFMAALSLALGLSGVVQAYAGGIVWIPCLLMKVLAV